MRERDAVIDYALAHGWDDDALEDLEQAVEKGLEEALAVLGERHCPAVEYCEMAALFLEWHGAIQDAVSLCEKNHIEKQRDRKKDKRIP